jgi:hypothetical protein
MPHKGGKVHSICPKPVGVKTLVISLRSLRQSSQTRIGTPSLFVALCAIALVRIYSSEDHAS